MLKNLAYRLIDWIYLGKGVGRVINGKKIRFPAKWSRYYEANYESENYSFIRSYIKPGMHIIDIGAHIGLFSVYTSQLTGAEGKVICFEPTPGTFSLLQQTLKLNHCENVIAVQAAVSDKDGTANFYISAIQQEGNNSNSLVKNRDEKDLNSYEVKLETIDGIVKTYKLKPSLIKIDAEGAELDVLKGGLKTFTEISPAIILGLHPDFIKQKGDNLEAIWDLLTTVPYKIELDGKAMTKEDFCRRELLFDVHCIKE